MTFLFFGRNKGVCESSIVQAQALRGLIPLSSPAESHCLLLYPSMCARPARLPLEGLFLFPSLKALDLLSLSSTVLLRLRMTSVLVLKASCLRGLNEQKN